MKVGRNAPCPCGSGKKYKNCCLGGTAGVFNFRQKLLAVLIGLIMVAGLLTVIFAYRSYEPSSGPGRVWSEEHQHWH